MSVLVTVGSTRFDELLEAVMSEEVCKALRKQGYKHLILQYGNSDAKPIRIFGDTEHFHAHGLDIEAWKFKPSLRYNIEQADLVISHAGSGTILEVLRMGKPLVVVPNASLLHNHQEELAVALSNLGHLKMTTLSGLADALATWNATPLAPFPSFDGTNFSKLLDEEMGLL
ncbi:glycosyltransferase family 1 protein [Coniophora puteana RWD-64-598 SS2]|uniref:UDP-N-acetylglucosamine transferase subunit ALG13 n=1 Tax=Coniophora puteana (strain RWD-64-598) TaxID=741705 RepID=A0A5M3N299_CONPW|nr:glycosyltransferase family 1 protein [Coniophora puteana RWD-64-598 SS2]EIW85055.1 glycosyltransferase family 1 protein [Coniophora puteana RWD-64-598 SS2]